MLPFLFKYDVSLYRWRTMKKVLIERIIADPSSDFIYSLGVKSEHEFLFEFIIRDEIANIAILLDSQYSICIANPYSSNSYKMMGSCAIIESELYNKFIDALELLKERKERDILLFRSPVSKYPELKLSLFEDVVIINYQPTRKRKKREQDQDIVKIKFDHVGRFIALVKKTKDLPYKEKVQFTEISFE